MESGSARRLYERVATGYLGPEKDTFYDLMSNGNYDALIDDEAGKIGLPAAQIASSRKTSCRFPVG